MIFVGAPTMAASFCDPVHWVVISIPFLKYFVIVSMWKKQGASSSGGAGFVASLLVAFSVAIIAVAIEVAASSIRNTARIAEEKKDKKDVITATGKGHDDEADVWEEKKDDTATTTTTPPLPTRAETTGGALSNPMFVASAERIKNLSNTKDGASLDNRDKLQLYSLYKQATVGNAPKWFTPSSFDLLVEQAKHHAWSQLRGMSWQEATQTYIQVAQALLLQVANKHGNITRQGNDNDDDDDDESIDHDALSDDEVDYTQPKTSSNMPSSSPRGNTSNNASMEPGGFGVGVSRPMVQEEEEETTDDSAETNVNTQKPPHVALLQAAAKNDVETIQRLINEQKQQCGGDNNNQEDAVRRLVDHCDEVGQTALHLAADRGFNDVVICLLNAGARVDAADQDGISVLQAAVIAGQTETCRILWQQGKADPDQPDHDGDTPRLCAQDDGSREMKLLFGLCKEQGGDAATAGAALNVSVESLEEDDDDEEEEDNVTQDTEANTTVLSEDINVTPESLQRKEISHRKEEEVPIPTLEESTSTTPSEDHSIEV